MSEAGIEVSSKLYDRYVPGFIRFVRRHRGRRTTHQLENALDRFFGWLEGLGIVDLDSLTAQHIRDLISSLQRFRPATIAVHASALRGFLKYLYSRGLLTVDLTPAVERPRLYRLSQPPKVLDPETVEDLLAAIDRSTALGKRDFAMMLLAARYGLRPSDIRSLCFKACQARYVMLRWMHRYSAVLSAVSGHGIRPC